MTMLAVKTITAIAPRPCCHSWTAPEKMVSLLKFPDVSVSRTGSTFAGMSITAAARARAVAAERPLRLKLKYRRLMPGRPRWRGCPRAP